MINLYNNYIDIKLENQLLPNRGNTNKNVDITLGEENWKIVSVGWSIQIGNETIVTRFKNLENHCASYIIKQVKRAA